MGPTGTEMSWALISWIPQLATTQRNYLYCSNKLCTCRLSGQMVYVTAFVPPGRGFEPSIMPKLSPFWLFLHAVEE